MTFQLINGFSYLILDLLSIPGAGKMKDSLYKSCSPHCTESALCVYSSSPPRMVPLALALLYATKSCHIEVKWIGSLWKIHILQNNQSGEIAENQR